MKKNIISFLIIFLISIAKIVAQDSKAADEILSKIIKAEIALKEKKPLNQEDLHEIVCLTNIETKNGEGNYIGITFLPSENEIQIWKDWFERNKTKISYSTSSEIFTKHFEIKHKVIQVEYEDGKFRNTVCDEDKKFQDYLQDQKQ